MKLSQWAKKQGISYMTAFRWFHKGQIPNAIQYPNGTIIVQEITQIKTTNEQVSIYCRVSSYEKKDDLERQVQRCTNFCIANGYVVKEIVKEIASGMNDKRPKLIKLLSKNPNHILVEHKDRLTRFGFNYFEELLPKMNCKLTVINRDSEEENDLMKDLISVITSFCCRLYGLRKGHKKVEKIKKELNDN